MIARDICVPLTDCINAAILNGVFPDELKLADVTPLYKKSDPDDKQIIDRSASYHHYPKPTKKYYINN